MEERPQINLTIDNQPVSVSPGTTLWEAARIAGINVPVLCHSPNLEQSAVCRVSAVQVAASILCARCVRACDQVQVNEVIGRGGKGYGAHIVFDDDRPMGESTCVSCGECAAACPTGALTDKPLVLAFDPPAMKAIDSACPYCGVGCSITYHVQHDTLVRVSGRPDGPANRGRLCVKGRYGFDYAEHPHRLTVPLVRREECYPKHALSPELEEGDYRRKRRGPEGVTQAAELHRNLMAAFREATWDEALALMARRFSEIKQEHGPGALAGFG